MRRPRPTRGLSREEKKRFVLIQLNCLKLNTALCDINLVMPFSKEIWKNSEKKFTITKATMGTTIQPFLPRVNCSFPLVRMKPMYWYTVLVLHSST
jgi:hypothetical protein